MPTYTYYCLACDLDCVKLAKIDERDDQKCDNCGSVLKRKIDRPGLVYAPTAGGYR